MCASHSDVYRLKSSLQMYTGAQSPKNLEIFCASGNFLRVFTKLPIKHQLPNSLETFLTNIFWFAVLLQYPYLALFKEEFWHFCMYVAKAIYAILVHIGQKSNAILAHICRKNDYALRPESFAHEILPTGRF